MSPLVEMPIGSIWYAGLRQPILSGLSASSDRPPLLLIHGAGGTHLHWPSQLRNLAGTAVVALDLPGHGRSAGPGREVITDYAESVLALLDGLELSRAVLCGHSMGGAVAQWLALERPDRVAAIVLMATGARLRVAPAVLDGLRADLGDTLGLLVEWLFGPQAPAELKAQGAAVLREVDPNVLYQDFVACDRFDVRDRLGEIKAPALVLGGTADVMTPLKFSHYLAERIPGAALKVIEGAGHMVPLERPDEVAAAVSEFLTGLA